MPTSVCGQYIPLEFPTYSEIMAICDDLDRETHLAEVKRLHTTPVKLTSHIPVPAAPARVTRRSMGVARSRSVHPSAFSDTIYFTADEPTPRGNPLCFRVRGHLLSPEDFPAFRPDPSPQNVLVNFFYDCLRKKTLRDLEALKQLVSEVKGRKKRPSGSARRCTMTISELESVSEAEES